MMAIGSIGARDRDGTPRSVLDWRRCSNSNGGAVPPVGCSSTVRIGLRLIISMAIAVMHAGQTSKRCMDTATMRRRGSMGTLSRTVCVTSIRTLRSGVLGNGHAPFWNSGRRSAPPLDCNKLSEVGTDIQPGTFIAEPDLAEGWEAPHSIGFSGNQRASAGRGKLTLDFLYPSDSWLRNSSENLPNNINMLEVYHAIRGNLVFSQAQHTTGVCCGGVLNHYQRH